MISIRKVSAAAGSLGIAALAFGATPASAQATRTWVSGVGDDVNPCSRTAPCKTFAGAISKTAAGGEINCLDPGGWGAVTITKAMTIDCSQFPGSILNAPTNGIIVNALALDRVVIRGLEISGGGGASGGTDGIRFLAGASLTVENVIIRNNTQANASGIAFIPSTNGELFVNNVTLNNNVNGIRVAPTGAGGTARVLLNNVRAASNGGVGFKFDMSVGTNGGGILATVNNSQVSGSGIAVQSIGTGAGLAYVTVANSTLFYSATTALSATGANAIIRVGTSTITGNSQAVTTASSGQVRSYGDNLTEGNIVPSSFTPPVIPKT